MAIGAYVVYGPLLQTRPINHERTHAKPRHYARYHNLYFISTKNITHLSNYNLKGERILKEPVAGCQVDGSNRKGTWSLVGSPSALRSFKIDAKSGVIHATRQLDFEDEASHRLAVQYRVSPSESGLQAPVIAVANVDVEVTDINDCSPEFEGADKYVFAPLNLTLLL